MLASLAYFDHNATTPVSPAALEAAVSVLGETYGNASSIHRIGQVARQSLETSRRHLASVLGCEAKEIIFTGGGTEADNIAIFGAVRRSPGRHIVTTAIEHAAVLGPCGQLEREGFEVTYVRPDPTGIVPPEEIRRALRPDTVLVTVMHANNEIGTVQPLEEIGALVRAAGVLFHVDGIQAVGRVPVNLRHLPVDLYAISAHKFYGPKGIGALYVRGGVELQPLQFGGRHEKSLRPGTENVSAASGLAAAASEASCFLSSEPARLSQLRDHLEQGIRAAVPRVTVNGARAPRLPNTTNLCFHGIEGEAMVIALDLRGFAVSSGSACSSGAVEPSHVLTALGLSRRDARSSVRISLGRSNTKEQVDAFVSAAAECAAHLRRLSPDYAHA
jgi:cysteine desulfurase